MILGDSENPYEVLSFYSLPDDAWSIELTDLSDGRFLAHVLIPDEDPERPCQVLTLERGIPADILGHYIAEVAESARSAGRSLERTLHLE